MVYSLNKITQSNNFLKLSDSFLNKYNEINDPDITSDMVSMKKLEGKDAMVLS